MGKWPPHNEFAALCLTSPTNLVGRVKIQPHKVEIDAASTWAGRFVLVLRYTAGVT